MTDGELVREARAGNCASYEELVRRWFARIAGFFHAKTGCPHIAEDLAQEVMIRGYLTLTKLEQPEKLGSWLYGIAQRVCHDWHRSKQRTEVQLSDDGHSANSLLSRETAAPDELVKADEQRELMRALEDLPDSYREVLMIYYYDDVTYRDIAVMLGVSTATINARLTKARAMLRNKLIERRS